jgi:hypothetical protein
MADFRFAVAFGPVIKQDVCGASLAFRSAASGGTQASPEESAAYAFARTPPVNGLATPVVPGNVMGSPLSERTAR